MGIGKSFLAPCVCGEANAGSFGSQELLWALAFLFLGRGVGFAMVFFGSPDSPISDEETACDVDGSAPGQLV